MPTMSDIERQVQDERDAYILDRWDRADQSALKIMAASPGNVTGTVLEMTWEIQFWRERYLAALSRHT